MEDILDIIVSRRSVKRFKNNMVEKSLIDKVLKAGMYAPSGKNIQSPIILAITNQDIRNKLSKLCANVRGLGYNADPFYGAPVVLSVLVDKNVFTGLYDGSCVLENMLLEAHSLGLGACWIHHCKEIFETSEGRDLLVSLGVQGDYVGVGSCILGYPDVELGDPLPRKDNYVYYIE